MVGHSQLDLAELSALARTFDAIGDEIGGARYPAVAFVQWLADEYAAIGRRPRRGDEAAWILSLPVTNNPYSPRSGCRAGELTLHD